LNPDQQPEVRTRGKLSLLVPPTLFFYIEKKSLSSLFETRTAPLKPVLVENLPSKPGKG
jgi:hypothetical protein